MVFPHPKGHFDGLSTIHRTGETQLCVGDNIAVHANIGPPFQLLHQYNYLFLLADEVASVINSSNWNDPEQCKGYDKSCGLR